MNELSTELNEWVILQHSGGKKYITEETAQRIIAGMGQGASGFKDSITGEWMTFSSISDVISMKEYYRRFPDKIPASSKEFEGEEIIPMTAEQIKKMQEGLLKGLKRFIDNRTAKGIASPNASAIYNHSLSKLQHSSQISSII